jgi:hypothetical protein
VNVLRVRAVAVLAACALTLGALAPALAGGVTIPLSQLGYRDGVTVAGVAPSVTFDLPRYASLQAAALHLELHVSAATDPHSTIAVAVNGKPAYANTLAAIGDDARLVIPLPLPAADAELFAITVSGALSVTGDACANNYRATCFCASGATARSCCARRAAAVPRRSSVITAARSR